jgi:hypothetical protein
MQKFTSPYIFYHFHRANQLPVKMELVDKRGNAVPVIFRSKLKRDDDNKGIDLVMNKPVQMKQLLSLVAEGMKLKACLENS